MGFGAQMEPDDDDDDLLAELAALEGRPNAKKKPVGANKGKPLGVYLNKKSKCVALYLDGHVYK